MRKFILSFNNKKMFKDHYFQPRHFNSESFIYNLELSNNDVEVLLFI